MKVIKEKLIKFQENFKTSSFDCDFSSSRNFRSSSIDCIIKPQRGVGGLFLGDYDSATNFAALKKYNITAILTVASGTNLKLGDQGSLNHRIIAAQDNKNFDMSVHFEEALEFIDEHRKNGNVLVHCIAGISRSSTIVIAYLIKQKKWSLSSSMSYVRGKRSIISPNTGFLEQLRAFESKTITKEKKFKGFFWSTSKKATFSSTV